MIVNDSSYKDPQALRRDGSVEADSINFSDGSTLTGVSGGGSVAAARALVDILQEQIDNTVYYGSTAQWNAQPQLVSEEKSIYIYSDYRQVDGQNVPGIKVGDGQAFVIDLPFIDAEMQAHIADMAVHVSAADRINWNRKVRGLIDGTDPELLILTTN